MVLMDLQIALLLGQDGVTNGAIYALLALALVLVFAVTRVIFIPQGEFVAFGALTLASLQAGRLPGTVWLLLAMGTAIALVEGATAVRAHRFRRLPLILLLNCGAPLLLAASLVAVSPAGLPLLVQVLLTLMLVVPLAPMLYRLAYQPIAEASVLALLIVSVAVHVTLTGLGLVFFGAEGSRTPPFTDVSFEVGDTVLHGQTVLVIVASILLIAALYFFFRTDAVRQGPAGDGDEPDGCPPDGHLGGSRGTAFVHPRRSHRRLLRRADFSDHHDLLRFGFPDRPQGLRRRDHRRACELPVGGAGAVLVGFLEAYSSFWASAFKEVIVFTLIIPVLLWRSLKTRHVEEA
jgi:branched-subunit amino acid ABC-type transport system permease component